MSVLAIAAAASGPIFLDAADNSALTDALAQAPAGAAALLLTESSGRGGFAGLQQVARSAGTAGGRRWFLPPEITVDAGVRVQGGGITYGGSLLARTGACGHLRLVAGSCPSGPGQVMLSARSGRALGLRVGQLVSFQGTSATVRRLRLRVTGLYAPPLASVAFWASDEYFDFGAEQKHQPVQLDAFVATSSTALDATRIGVIAEGEGVLGLAPRSLRSDTVGPFERSLRTLEAAAGRQGLVSSTQLFGLLAGIEHAESQMRTVVEATVVQLVGLSLLVLYSIIVVNRTDRRLESSIARRRGFARRWLVVVAVAEPAALLVGAVPVGILLAWSTIATAGVRLFAPGTPVGASRGTVLAALAAFGVGLAATTIGTLELRRGRMGRLPGTPRRSVLAAVDAVAVALAAAGVIALSAQGSLDGTRADPVAALAPALLAVGAGVVGLRVAGWAVTAAVPLTRDSRRVAAFLALRSVARRSPSSLRQILLLTVALVLAIFSASSWAVAASNRSRVATFDNGAARVVTVRVRPGVDLVSAVDAADPSRRYAMAAALYRAPDATLLGVDPSRFAAVAAWPNGVSNRSAALIARYLAPATSPPLLLAGGRLRLEASLSAGSPPLGLTATVFSPVSQDQLTITAGTIRPGTHHYVSSLGGFCLSACRLVDLSPAANNLGRHPPPTVTLTLRGVQVASGSGPWRNVGPVADPLGGWESQPSSVRVQTHARPAAASFAIPSSLITSEGIILAPADLPAVIPAVATQPVVAANDPAPPDDIIPIDNIDGGTINVAVQVGATSLPGAGTNAVLVNLILAQRAQVGPDDATFQVWLRAGAPASILRRLTSYGVTTQSTALATTRLSALNRGPLALAYILVLSAAPLGLLLAVGAVIFSIVASGRRRRSERRALDVAGIPPRIVARAVLLENGLVLGVALVLGTVVGIAATVLAVASLPQFPDGSGGVPIRHGITFGPVVIVVGAVAVLLAATTVATTLVVTRQGELGWAGAEP